MQGLYTNSSSRRDFFHNAVVELTTSPCRVFCAVAFFTSAKPILEMVAHGCRVNLVVRLAYPTQAKALEEVVTKEGVKVRYLTDHSFHPKLYIFDEQAALVGSSNLTDSAFLTNQEVNVAVPVQDPRYEELRLVFQEYWDAGRTLDLDGLKTYRELQKQFATELGAVDRLEQKVLERLGRIAVPNINRGLMRSTSEEIDLEGYRKTYQDFLTAYRTVERVYLALGKRHYPEQQLPLRIEIDQFFNFIREKKTHKDSYADEPLLAGPALEAKVAANIEEWQQIRWRHLDEVVFPKSFPTINRVLGTPAAIDAASWDDIIDALSSAHSFYDRLRFFSGGHNSHVDAFKRGNSLETVKRTLSYLVHGEGAFVDRMGRCVFSPAYHLAEFGRSAVQEVLGWVNRENIPICNNRTLRALRFLGFEVASLGG